MGMYNEKGVLDFNKYDILTRAYAPYIQGNLISKSYDIKNSIFILEYMVDTSINGATEIYLNAKDHFMGGYVYSLDLHEQDEHKYRIRINEAEKNYFKVQV